MGLAEPFSWNWIQIVSCLVRTVWVCFPTAVKEPVSTDTLPKKEQIVAESRQKPRIIYQVKTTKFLF